MLLGHRLALDRLWIRQLRTWLATVESAGYRCCREAVRVDADRFADWRRAKAHAASCCPRTCIKAWRNHGRVSSRTQSRLGHLRGRETCRGQSDRTHIRQCAYSAILFRTRLLHTPLLESRLATSLVRLWACDGPLGAMCEPARAP